MEPASFSDLPHRPFVVFAYPRTGSYLLVSLLDQFPGLRCYGEVYKKEKIELPEEILSSLPETIESRDREPAVFMKRLVSLTPDVHTGFKLFSNHNVELRDWIVSNGEIKKVILTRNPLEIYVSHLRAVATGKWIDKRGKQRKEVPRLLFTPEDFERKMHNICQTMKYLDGIADGNPESSIKISYADVARIEPVRAIADFLGCSAQPGKLEVGLHRQTKERYSELFENFNELEAYVAANRPDLLIDPAKI